MRGIPPKIDAEHPPPRLAELPDPEPRPGEIVVGVHASGLNRVDLLQIRGRYPVPEGESDIPGLECSGVVERLGPEVEEDSRWRVGDSVMALLGGGGHAERVAVPAGQLMPLPPGWTYEQGAATPEAALTAWVNLVEEGRLQPGERVLIAGVSGGVGSFACQLARELGVSQLFGTSRSRERLEALRKVGLTHGEIEDEGLAARVRQQTEGHGVDLILDFVGGEGFTDRLGLLAPGGRLVLLGLMGGVRGSIDLSPILRRTLHIVGSLLRPRPRAEKARLVAAFDAFARDRLADGRLRPVLAGSFPAEQAAAAYDVLTAGGRVGKLVLRWI